jgi:hypothetical protein
MDKSQTVYEQIAQIADGLRLPPDANRRRSTFAAELAAAFFSTSRLMRSASTHRHEEDSSVEETREQRK